jgi:hypothetical protein
MVDNAQMLLENSPGIVGPVSEAASEAREKPSAWPAEEVTVPSDGSIRIFQQNPLIMGTYGVAGAGHQWYNRSVLEDALQRSSIQGSDQADVDGLTEGIIA